MMTLGHNIISHEISYSYLRSEIVSDELTICYGTDSSFMVGAAISCASVAYTNPEVNISIHIFTDEINDFFLSRFERLSKLEKITIHIHVINIELLSSLPKNRLWSAAIYYRFIIADYFFGKKDTILYLDSDVVCLNEISSMFKTNIQGAMIGAVLERDHNWWKVRAEKLGVHNISNGYFNSGVLLINTREWYNNKVSLKALNLLGDDDMVARLTYYDQDVLNIITCGRVVFLESKYNTQYSLNYALGNKHHCPSLDNVTIFHYIGPTKPWHSYACHYDISRPFFCTKQRSPWSDLQFQKPCTSMQLRYGVKHMMKKREWMQAISYQFLYLKTKLMKK